MPAAARTSPLARLFGHPRADIIALETGLWISGASGTGLEPYTAIDSVQVRRGLLWGTLDIRRTDGTSTVLTGLRRARRVALAANLWRHHGPVAELLSEFDYPGGSDQYLTHAKHAGWLLAARAMLSNTPQPKGDAALPTGPLESRARLRMLVEGAEIAREGRNGRYADRQAAKHAALFDGAQGYPLNDRQVASILHDEGRCLVVAGAGTGKTSTIVGKAAHVLAEGLARPDEILLLAFTNKAAEEIEERLVRLTGARVAVKTFHALGLQVLAEAIGKKPTLSKLAEDELALRTFVEKSVVELATSAGTSGPMAAFLAYHRYPYRDRATFQTPHEFHQYVRGHDVRTLKGERVKSVEESVIANWLAMNGVRYEYERRYEHDTASIQYRQYQPDFYLPDFGVYIEHFGLNKDGQPPPFVDDAQKYLNSIRWKRDLHRRHGTRLVETFSYQAAAGTLTRDLEQALMAKGVGTKPISPEQWGELASREETVSPVAKLMCAFLNLYKGNAWTREEVRARLTDPRGRVFIEAFERVLDMYERALRSEGAIDFSDMINAAAEAANARRFRSKFRYILVDEYQDISRGRARLLNALLGQVDDSRLFCVGDDWQSIFRFTGSDIDLMTKFAEHFGFTRRTDLVQTHRFGEKLLQATSRFVSTNPQQLSKQLLAARRSELPAIEIVSVADRKEPLEVLAAVYRSIASEDRREHIDVLVVGRYRFCLEEARSVRAGDDRLSLRFMTVHRAKGLEADYAVVLNVVGGRYGFPTEITDDPLLDLVLASKGFFPNAEERRLFYVALSRARSKCFVITDDINRSVFVDELEGPGYAGLVIPSGASQRTVACPACKGGRLERQEGDWGVFWGCSNFPLCRGKARACPWCGQGAFVRSGTEYRCAAPECGESAPVCPSCGLGALLMKDGKFGPFIGCTEWHKTGPSCGYTQKCPPNEKPPP